MPKSQMQKADCTLRSSQAVPHPSTNRALRRLTSEVGRDLVYSTRYGRQRYYNIGLKFNLLFSPRKIKKMVTLLDLCVSSLRRGHANLLCIVPILTDDPRRESNWPWCFRGHTKEIKVLVHVKRFVGLRCYNYDIMEAIWWYKSSVRQSLQNSNWI